MREGFDARAMSPVVSKTLEIGLVVLYLGVISTSIYGGAIPEYRTLAGEEVTERTLASSAQRIEQAVPATPVDSVSVERTVSLPETIRGSTYVIETDARALVLDHPDPGIDERIPLVLPASVVSVTGEWRSDGAAMIIVTGEADAINVELRTTRTRGGTG